MQMHFILILSRKKTRKIVYVRTLSNFYHFDNFWDKDGQVDKIM